MVLNPQSSISNTVSFNLQLIFKLKQTGSIAYQIQVYYSEICLVIHKYDNNDNLGSSSFCQILSPFIYH